MGNLINKYIKKHKQNINTKKFISSNKKLYCKILEVYDGNIIVVGVLLNNEKYRIKVRLDGYNSYKIYTNNNNNNNINKAIQAKNNLAYLVLNKIGIILISKNVWDKDNNLLVTLFINNDNSNNDNSNNEYSNNYNFNVNKYMIYNGYGYKL